MTVTRKMDLILGAIIVGLMYSIGDINARSGGGKDVKGDACEESTRGEDKHQKLPTFQWDKTAKQMPFKLIVDFHDGGEPDVASLFPDVIDEEEDPCLLIGALRDENDVSVAVVGCPNNNTEPYDITMHSSRHQGGAYEVINGKTEEIIMDDCGTDEGQTHGQSFAFPEASAKAPSSFQLKLALYYDNEFLKNVGKNSQTTARNEITKIVHLAKTYFHGWGNKGNRLQSSIDLNVVHRGHVNENLKLGRGAQSLERISDSHDHRSNTEADNYHYFSYDSQGGVAGKAWGNTICMPNNNRQRNYKTAITEWLPQGDTDHSRLRASFRFAHELGHSLGMNHDMGRAGCQDIGGIMDYHQKHYNKWSQCSADDMDKADLSCKSSGCFDDPGAARFCRDKQRYRGCNGANRSYFQQYCKKSCGVC